MQLLEMQDSQSLWCDIEMFRARSDNMRRNIESPRIRIGHGDLEILQDWMHMWRSRLDHNNIAAAVDPVAATTDAIEEMEFRSTKQEYHTS